MPHPPFLPDTARPALASALLALPLFLAACGQEPNGSSTAGPSDSEAIAEAEPFTEWINLDGRVVSAGPSEFLLDYGRGRINVEVDGWRFYDRGKGLLPGDRVQVSGRLDENFFTANTIEADSVYVKNRDTV